MSNHKLITLATVPVFRQILFSIDGFTVELCKNRESMATAFRLRYKAYKAIDAVEENEAQLLYDAYDFRPNTHIFLVWFQSMPVATVRACIYSDQFEWEKTEGIKSFPEDVAAKLGVGTRFLESNRYAVDPEFKGRKSLYAQMMMFRAHALASAAHRCNYVITLVREKHVPFYRRFLGFEAMSDQAKYIPWADASVVLLGVEREESYALAQKHGLPPVTENGVVHFADCAGIEAVEQVMTA